MGSPDRALLLLLLPLPPGRTSEHQAGRAVAHIHVHTTDDGDRSTSTLAVVAVVVVVVSEFVSFARWQHTTVAKLRKSFARSRSAKPLVTGSQSTVETQETVAE